MVRWHIFFVILFLYRSLYSVLGQTVIVQLTTLGDSRRYQGRAKDAFSDAWYKDSTAFTDTVGQIFQSISFGSPILINIYFQTVAFIGLYMLLMALEPPVRKRLALLLMLPSFSLWSSVASKESIIVLALSLVGTYLIDIYYNREKLKFRHLFGFYLLFVFKAHYLAALVFVFGITKVARHVKQKALFAFGAGLLSLVPLYLFRDKIDALSFEIIPHFIGQGRSTREAFWVNQYDVFLKAPEGMFQAFFGPSFIEASNNFIQRVAFAESAILVAILVFFALRSFPALPAYSFFLGGFTLFWLLFANYPVGIMNPGTAIRYRTGYMILIFLIFAFLMSRKLYTDWSGSHADVSAGPSRSKGDSLN